jgi:thiol-disulfide isomerase/thioredoxin
MWPMRNLIKREGMSNRVAARLIVGAMVVSFVLTLGVSAQTESKFQSPILPPNSASIDGTPLTLDDGGGPRLVILDFFTSTCLPCRPESQKVAKLQQKFGPNQILLLGVDVREDQSRAQLFARETKIKFPIMLDDGKLEARYQVYMYPVVLVFDRHTNLLYRFEGANSRIEALVERLLKSRTAEISLK